MNRLDIKNYARFLFQELSESPEGLIKDSDETDETDLNVLVNISLATVELDLIPIIPQEFRSSFLISLEATKQSYHLEDDLSVTDYLAMEDIFHNEAAKLPQGLLYITHDQLPDYDINVDETASRPRVWTWEEKDKIGVYPIPSATIADILKAFYFKAIPELAADDEIPAFPVVAHHLVGIDVALQLMVADEGGARNVSALYGRELSRVGGRLKGLKPSLRTDMRYKLSETVR